MQSKFNRIMNNSGVIIVDQVSEGELYALLYNMSWHRIQVIGPVEQNGTVSCLLVDIGEQLNVSVDQICLLNPEFKKIRNQVNFLFIILLFAKHLQLKLV